MSSTISDVTQLHRLAVIDHYIRNTPIDDGDIACRNCVNAKVRRAPSGDIDAYCSRGHGAPRSLAVLLRPRYSRGMAAARDCADWHEAQA